MKKVLIITYYWPPGAGPGVFRWLQLSKYLVRNGIETHILTVKPKWSSYYQLDYSNLEQVESGISVHRTIALDIIGLAQKINPASSKQGFNTVSKKGFFNWIRSNLFVPDTRIGWNYFALRKAKNLISEYAIPNVITTSPPHSTQLLGLALKKSCNINWIADFRDPWVDIFYRDQFLYLERTKNKLKAMEMAVLNGADKVLTSSPTNTQNFRIKLVKEIGDKVQTLTNGFDYERFENTFHSRKNSNKVLNITYIGTITDQYNPEVFFRAIGELKDRQVNLELTFVGSVSPGVSSMIGHYGLNKITELVGSVNHSSALEYIQKSDLLLLVIPEAEHDIGIIPGKLFEYLASQKTILAIGSAESDVAKILNDTNCGRVFERSQSREIVAYIHRTLNGSIDKNPIGEELYKYDRRAQASEVSGLLVTGDQVN